MAALGQIKYYFYSAIYISPQRDLNAIRKKFEDSRKKVLFTLRLLKIHTRLARTFATWRISKLKPEHKGRRSPTFGLVDTQLTGGVPSVEKFVQNNLSRNGGKGESVGSARARKHRRVANSKDALPIMSQNTLLNLTTGRALEQTLHHEILNFVSFIMPTPQERVARQSVFSAIANVLQKQFPKAEVALFGSVTHDLCLPDGDLDICFRLEDKPISDVRKSLYQFSGLFRAAGISNDIRVIKWARVPVVSLMTTPNLGSFKADIGINNVDGVMAIETINDYLSGMPALRPLVMIVKAFLGQRDLNSAATSGLSSYAIICMAISFLQLNPTNLPADFIEKPLETEALGNLLLDFFSYYGTSFPYETSYISVTEGKLLPKSSAKWIKERSNDLLSIQCLVRPNNDIAKATGKIKAVKDAFREAHATLLRPRPPRHLERIVTVSQSMLYHRMHIRSIVDSGRLLRAMGSIVYSPARTNPSGRYPRNYTSESSIHSERATVDEQ